MDTIKLKNIDEKKTAPLCMDEFVPETGGTVRKWFYIRPNEIREVPKDIKWRHLSNQLEVVRDMPKPIEKEEAKQIPAQIDIKVEKKETTRKSSKKK